MNTNSPQTNFGLFSFMLPLGKTVSFDSIYESNNTFNLVETFQSATFKAADLCDFLEQNLNKYFQEGKFLFAFIETKLSLEKKLYSLSLNNSIIFKIEIYTKTKDENFIYYNDYYRIIDPIAVIQINIDNAPNAVEMYLVAIPFSGLGLSPTYFSDQQVKLREKYASKTI